jgi:hypothetical protein
VVEGVLRVFRHRARLAPDGSFLPAFAEYRIEADHVR